MKELLEKVVPVMEWLGIDCHIEITEELILVDTCTLINLDCIEPYNAEALCVIREALLKKEKELIASDESVNFWEPLYAMRRILDLPWREATTENVLRLLSEVTL